MITDPKLLYAAYVEELWTEGLRPLSHTYEEMEFREQIAWGKLFRRFERDVRQQLQRDADSGKPSQETVFGIRDIYTLSIDVARANPAEARGAINTFVNVVNTAISSAESRQLESATHEVERKKGKS